MACCICKTKTPFFSDLFINGVGEVCEDCHKKAESVLDAFKTGDESRAHQIRDNLIRKAPNETVRSGLLKYFQMKEKTIYETREKSLREEQRRLREKQREEEATLRRIELQKNSDVIAAIPVITTEKFDGYKIYPKKVLLSATEAVNQKIDSNNGDFGYSNHVEQAKKAIIRQFQQEAFLNDCNAIAALRFQLQTVTHHISSSSYSFLLLSATATAMQIALKKAKDTSVN